MIVALGLLNKTTTLDGLPQVVRGAWALLPAFASSRLRRHFKKAEKSLRAPLRSLRGPDDRITNSRFRGEGDSVASQALDSLDSMGGFTLVLAAAKVFLEHGINLNIVADRFPEA